MGFKVRPPMSKPQGLQLFKKCPIKPHGAAIVKCLTEIRLKK